MKISVYKYIGKYGMGFIFTLPGRGIDKINYINSTEWTFMDVYDIDKKFLDECTEKCDDRAWKIDYIE